MNSNDSGIPAHMTSTPPDVLKKILQRKAEEITERSARQSLEALRDRLAAAPRLRHPVAALHALVDEIDEVLEENAEEFVKNYVQKGGE